MAAKHRLLRVPNSHPVKVEEDHLIANVGSLFEGDAHRLEVDFQIDREVELLEILQLIDFFLSQGRWLLAELSVRVSVRQGPEEPISEEVEGPHELLLVVVHLDIQKVDNDVCGLDLVGSERAADPVVLVMQFDA